MLVVIAAGSFLAAFVNAAFATGGAYILLAVTSAVLPLTTAIPLLSAFALSSQIARCTGFWFHIHWPIVLAAGLGTVLGVALGARVFVSLPETALSLLLGVLLLTLVWAPGPKWRFPVKHPFFLVGALHAFTASIFGVGAFLQPAILRTSLVKLQITATLAACLFIIELFKMGGYVAYGFDYLAYLPHIILAAAAGVAGTWAGARVTHRISERTFRLTFSLLITLVALRLLYRGWTLL